MKKILCLLMLTIPLFASKCEHILKESDKYLQQISNTNDIEFANSNSTIALAYYKRFEICIYQYEDKKENYTTRVAKEFNIISRDK